jgi:predicted SnoaL-like aldol condensation-catalyzing enzyme
MTGSKFDPVAVRRTGIFTGAAMALALLAAPLAASAADAPAKGLEANKKAAVAFYEAAINRKDYAAAVAYLGPQYKQHNPTAADGAEGLKGFIEFLKAKFPNQKGDIKSVIAEGDKVVLHVHSTRGDGTPGRAIVDIFRLENGKVVEHWDVIQDIPEKAANSNGMF